ncbi:MAG: M3 family metallopeptidase [Planctomycetaceae bacterium]
MRKKITMSGGRKVLMAAMVWLAAGDAMSQDTPSNPRTTVENESIKMVENALLKPSSLPYSAPDFAAVKTELFLPAFKAAMEAQLEEIRVIADQTEPASFENTLTAMERSGSALKRVQAVFFHLAGADTTPQIQEIEAEISPQLAAHSDDIYLNGQLFSRIDHLWQQREKLDLNEEQSRLLKETYESFVRAGARLSKEQQARVREINERLSSLSTQFQTNLLAVTKERSVVVDQASQLEGMSTAEIAAAKEAAKAKGLDDKYLLSITNTTRQPVLVSLKDRSLRKRVWEASAYRAQGQEGGIDNRPLVLELASLRAERAKLLGYANHAAFTLENQMAAKPDAAFEMLRDLVPQVVAKAKQEAEAIEALMRKDGIEEAVQPWDWEYYAEKVRQEKYQVDESLVKPYFELESVLKNGVFFTMNQLYGIEFRERKDLPVYHPTVRVFDVLDASGNAFGLFYADYYERDSKRGGAWMDALISQSKLLDQAPVIVNVMNIPRPADGQPTLISLDNVTTMFHEMGHAVHGLFSAVTYPTLSGTNVPRDFVEFPSTFHEDWAIDPKVLKNFAKHHQTGEVIPDELLKKSIEASKFNQGFDTLEYLAAALLDLSWHTLAPGDAAALAAGPAATVEDFEAKSLAEYDVDFAPVPPRYKSPYFAHVWSGGYSAGYYAYLWSEVLAADAFAHMKATGGLTAANGDAFRKAILSKGGSREVMQQYIDFRGQKPAVDALLKRRGLR